MKIRSDNSYSFPEQWQDQLGVALEASTRVPPPEFMGDGAKRFRQLQAFLSAGLVLIKQFHDDAMNHPETFDDMVASTIDVWHSIWPIAQALMCAERVIVEHIHPDTYN